MKSQPQHFIFYENLQFNPLSISGLASHFTCAGSDETDFMRI